MKELIGQERIQARITEIALEIDKYYLNQYWYRMTKKPVFVIGVLNGAFFFMADLIKQLSIRIDFNFIKVSTYPPKSKTEQKTQCITRLDKIPYDSNILLLDDILDSGRTIKRLKRHLKTSYPESVTTAVLLRKLWKAKDGVTVDFIGFDMPDEWVAGYGMDDRNGLRREVPFIFIDNG